MPRQRFIHHIDISPQSRRYIVELLYASTRALAVPLLRIRIALHIKLKRLPQRVKPSIVKERSPRSEIQDLRSDW